MSEHCTGIEILRQCESGSQIRWSRFWNDSEANSIPDSLVQPGIGFLFIDSCSIGSLNFKPCDLVEQIPLERVVNQPSIFRHGWCVNVDRVEPAYWFPEQIFAATTRDRITTSASRIDAHTAIKASDVAPVHQFELIPAQAAKRLVLPVNEADGTAGESTACNQCQRGDFVARSEDEIVLISESGRCCGCSTGC